MENHLFYHFWLLKKSEIPFDIEKDYCYLGVANDKKYIEDYMVNQKYLKYLFENDPLSELLNVYLNVLYDENHPEDIKNKAIDWISHTIKILLEADIFYNFINLKILEHIVKDFKPSNEIDILKLDENKTPKLITLDRNDPFLQQIITVNININTPNNIEVNLNENTHEKTQENLQNKEENEIVDYNGVPMKVKALAIMELLEKLNIKRMDYNNTQICHLIAYLTGNSYDYIYNNVDKNMTLNNRYRNHIKDINQIFKDLGVAITMKIFSCKH